MEFQVLIITLHLEGLTDRRLQNLRASYWFTFWPRQNWVIRCDCIVIMKNIGCNASGSIEWEVIGVFQVIGDVVCISSINHRVDEIDVDSKGSVSLYEVSDICGTFACGPRIQWIICALTDEQLSVFEGVWCKLALYWDHSSRWRAEPLIKTLSIIGRLNAVANPTPLTDIAGWKRDGGSCFDWGRPVFSCSLVH